MGPLTSKQGDAREKGPRYRQFGSSSGQSLGKKRGGSEKLPVFLLPRGFLGNAAFSPLFSFSDHFSLSSPRSLVTLWPNVPAWNGPACEAPDPLPNWHRALLGGRERRRGCPAGVPRPRPFLHPSRRVQLKLGGRSHSVHGRTNFEKCSSEKGRAGRFWPLSGPRRESAPGAQGEGGRSRCARREGGGARQ